MLDPHDWILLDEIDKDGPQSYSRTYSFSPAELDRIDIVDGTSKFTADLACSRCLEPYPFASSSTFHLRFRPRPELPQQEEEEIEIAPEDLDVEFYTERSISLRELALEQIQLSIPMKPLCNEACLGLCPQCGVNRNRETCACESSMVDERWGALREIQQVLKKRES